MTLKEAKDLLEKGAYIIHEEVGTILKDFLNERFVIITNTEAKGIDLESSELPLEGWGSLPGTNFTVAFDFLILGLKVTRRIWNEGTILTLARPMEQKVSDNKYLSSFYPGEDTILVEPHFDLITPKRLEVGINLSAGDILAHDWILLWDKIEDKPELEEVSKELDASSGTCEGCDCNEEVEVDNSPSVNESFES